MQQPALGAKICSLLKHISKHSPVFMQACTCAVDLFQSVEAIARRFTDVLHYPRHQTRLYGYLVTVAKAGNYDIASTLKHCCFLFELFSQHVLVFFKKSKNRNTTDFTGRVTWFTIAARAHIVNLFSISAQFPALSDSIMNHSGCKIVAFFQQNKTTTSIVHNLALNKSLVKLVKTLSEKASNHLALVESGIMDQLATIVTEFKDMHKLCKSAVKTMSNLLQNGEVVKIVQQKYKECVDVVFKRAMEYKDQIVSSLKETVVELCTTLANTGKLKQLLFGISNIN